MVRLSLTLCFILFMSTIVYAQGSSFASAISLSPSGSGSGTITDASTNHFWKVTTTTDGYLRILLSSASTIDIDVTLYDTDTTSYITYDSRAGTNSEVFGFLKPGTYYLRIYRYTGTTGTYTMTTSFVAPSRPTEQEPNDTPSNAVSLSPTGSATGHLGFFGSRTTDSDDYWKITTTQDGWLRVQVTSDSLDLRGDQVFDVDMMLYDINSTSYITYDSRAGAFSEMGAFLRPGTYFVRVYQYRGRGATYTIKTDFFTPPLANDSEGNDSYQTASTAPINGSVTGHLGYYSSGTYDSQDYWKFSVSTDGKVTVQMTSDSLDRSGVVFDLDMTVYDVNGTSYIAYDSRSGKFSECVAYLRPGVYYVRLYIYRGNAASYTMSITQTPPTRANDVEGNDWFASATPLSFNVPTTGHMGYFSNNFTDNTDYWRLVAPSSDSIYVHIFSDTTIDLDVTSYAPDTVNYISYDSRAGTYSRVGLKPNSGSTYYVRIYRYNGTAGGYTIIASRSSIATGVGQEPNVAVIPTELSLDQNYPNPFNPSTTIRYSLPENTRVRISVYTLLGQEIATLVNAAQLPSVYTIVWNGKDQLGRDVPSGVYLVRLLAGEKQMVKKAMLIR